MTDARNLETSLHALRAELRSAAHDDATRERLEALVADIERKLADPAAAEEEPVGDRLKASVLAFEASHPKTATLMNDLIEQLGKMGI